MKLKITLNTKINRALFIGLVWCMVASVSSFFLSENNEPKPSDKFYFVTKQSDSTCLFDDYKTSICLDRQIEMMPNPAALKMWMGMFLSVIKVS